MIRQEYIEEMNNEKDTHQITTPKQNNGQEAEDMITKKKLTQESTHKEIDTQEDTTLGKDKNSKNSTKKETSCNEATR